MLREGCTVWDLVLFLLVCFALGIVQSEPGLNLNPFLGRIFFISWTFNSKLFGNVFFYHHTTKTKKQKHPRNICFSKTFAYALPFWHCVNTYLNAPDQVSTTMSDVSGTCLQPTESCGCRKEVVSYCISPVAFLPKTERQKKGLKEEKLTFAHYFSHPLFY